MSIDTVNNIILNAGDKSLNYPRQSEPAKAAESDSPAAVLGSECELVVRESLASKDIDVQAVAEAQKALSEGALDSAESAEGAADHILKFGI